MDNIFGYFIPGEHADSKRLAYAGWFVDSFPKTEFEGDELLFWYFCDFCVNLDVPLKFKYLETWLSTEAKKVILADSIRVPGCEAMNYTDPLAFENAYRISCDVLKDDYNVLERMQLDVNDFPVEVASFISKKKKERLTACLSKTFNLLSDTEDSEKAADFAMTEMNLIEDIYDEEILEDLGIQTAGKDKPVEFVTDTGLPAIDQDCGGLYKRQVIGIEAQPGTGKTRFNQGHLVYRAMTLYKKNCLCISLEQDAEELKAMLIARHVFTLFHKVVNDAMIYRNTVPEDLKQEVEAARLDLFESGRYGKCVCRYENFNVEDFRQRLKNLDRMLGPFDLISIDYMGLFESKPGPFKKAMSTAEIISEAYKLFKRFCKRNNKAGVAVGQFNREGITAGLADKAITTDMAQGGLNIYRHTDYNIAISMTEEMRAKGQRRFSQPKVRSSAGFGTFITDTKLGICLFKQVVRKEV